MSNILTQIFPITLACNHNGWSALSFQRSFIVAKPDNLTWYGYDTIIHSPTDVEFVVYDMEDNAAGGLGKQIAQFKTTVSEALTADAIERKIVLLATMRREAEIRAAEQAILLRYADEFRSEFAVAISDLVSGSSTEGSNG